MIPNTQSSILTFLTIGLAAGPLFGDGADFTVDVRPDQSVEAFTDRLDEATAGAEHTPRVLHLPQTGKTVITWQQADDAGELVPHYAISRDGEQIHRAGPTSYTLRLRYAEFDPLTDGEPALPAGLSASADIGEGDRGTEGGNGAAGGEGNEIYIVQFVTQPIAEYRADIEALGGTIHKFLAHHAYLVRMDEATREQVEGLEHVRWVGAYHPAYRLDPAIVEELTAEPIAMGAARFRVQVFERGLAQKNIVADFIEGIGGQIDLKTPNGFIVEATLSPEQLVKVAHRNEVMFIDRWTPAEDDMDIAREISGANYVESVGGYTGEGVRGEVKDRNINLDHAEFQAIPPMVRTGLYTDPHHGTAAFGIIFASGEGNSTARGMIPDAQGIFSNRLDVDDRYAHTAELLEEPYYGAFQSNSWGNSQTTDYNTYSMEMDDILFDMDLLIFQSQSNTGDQNSRPQAWAKNVVAVGGVRHQNTLTKSDDEWGGSASIGPAADGRIKPDFTHFYDWIFTTAGDGGYTASFGGTSGATPITAGHFGLLLEMWNDGIFGNEVDPDASVFENRPVATTSRALMINTAAQYPFTGLGHDMTRAHQGWGMADVGRLYDRSDRMFIVDADDILENLESRTYSFEPAVDADALRATLVHLDPPGTTSSNLHRINDLTLEVTSPGGETYYGNVGLMEGVWSEPAGQPGGIDTVENVFVENPEPGSWEITVIASEINEDGVPDVPVFGSTYSLVVSGVDPVGLPGDLTGDGTVGGADLGILLSQWGECDDLGDCPADLTGDGTVGGADLGVLLSNWSN